MMSHKKLCLLLLLPLTYLSACKKSSVVSPGKGMNLSLTPIEQQKVITDNGFALRLFKNLDSANTNGSNLFVSPLSVSFALGMTSNGANGKTLTAIQNTMGFNGFTQDQLNSYYNKLLTDLPKLDPNTTLNIANSIWYRQGFSVLPDFLKTNNTSYNAKIEALDFSNPSSVNTINNWVNTQTEGKIPAVVNAISPSDVMYLVNAIYFKSTWKEKFNVAGTHSQTFYLDDNSQVQTNFMNGTIDFNVYKSTDATVVELPYSNSKYSMVIVVPPANTSVHQLIAGIDSAKWQNWMAGLKPVNGQLSLPKFKFAFGTQLNSALIDLGMGIAFSKNADFSLISATSPLQITSVNHKAFIDVDETGTTAAAATTVVVGLTATPVFYVNINHPFLFAIREMSSGLILFTGTVNNPALAGN